MYKLLIVLLGLMTVAAAGNFDTYGEVKSALEDGKNLSLVIDFSECDNKPDMQLELIIRPNNFKIYPEVITFYIDGLALNNPSFPNIPVYEHTQYVIKRNAILRVLGSDVIEVWGSILSADRTKILRQVNKPIVCKLGKAANLYD